MTKKITINTEGEGENRGLSSLPNQTCATHRWECPTSKSQAIIYMLLETQHTGRDGMQE